MKYKRFNIDYYYGEEVEMPELQKKDFDSIQEATDWCKNHKIPLYMISITEWNPCDIDAYGVPEYIGSCNLEEAFECNYTSLDFY